MCTYNCVSTRQSSQLSWRLWLFLFTVMYLCSFRTSPHDKGNSFIINCGPFLTSGHQCISSAVYACCSTDCIIRCVFVVHTGRLQRRLRKQWWKCEKMRTWTKITNTKVRRHRQQQMATLLGMGHDQKPAAKWLFLTRQRAALQGLSAPQMAVYHDYHHTALVIVFLCHQMVAVYHVLQVLRQDSDK